MMYKADVLYEILSVKSCVCLTVLVANLRINRWWLQPVVISRCKNNKISNTTEVRCLFVTDDTQHLSRRPCVLGVVVFGRSGGTGFVHNDLPRMLSRIHCDKSATLCITCSLSLTTSWADISVELLRSTREHLWKTILESLKTMLNCPTLSVKLMSVICAWPRLHSNVFRWKLRAFVPFGPETGAIRKSGVFHKCRRGPCTQRWFSVFYTSALFYNGIWKRWATETFVSVEDTNIVLSLLHCFNKWRNFATSTFKTANLWCKLAKCLRLVETHTHARAN